MCDIIVADLPSLGEPGDLTYAPNGIQLHPGGHSANVSINLIKLGLRDIAVVGGVGDDVFGEFLEKRLEQYSLDVYAERQSGIRTSKNVALIVRGEDRRFYAELAANTMLSPDHVISILELTRPKVFYQGTVGGLKLVDERLDLILSSARKIDCMTFVDIIQPKNRGWRKLRESLPLIDVLHCNNSESTELTGEKDPLEAAKNITKEGVKLCLITMGPNGVLAATGEKRLKIPSFDVHALDQTGAGDAFCAGVIHSLLLNGIRPEVLSNIPLNSLKKALIEGEAAGATCVTAVGATTAVNRRSVDELIEEQGDSVWQKVESL